MISVHPHTPCEDTVVLHMPSTDTTAEELDLNQRHKGFSPTILLR
jgi:hypothetical protein